MELDLPFWVIAIFLAIVIVPVIFSGVGAYYLSRKKFSVVSLIVAAVIFAGFELLIFVNAYDGQFPSPWVGKLGAPFTFFAYMFVPGLTMMIVFTIIGMILNFLAIFAVVNVIVRLFRRLSQH